MHLAVASLSLAPSLESGEANPNLHTQEVLPPDLQVRTGEPETDFRLPQPLRPRYSQAHLLASWCRSCEEDAHCDFELEGVERLWEE